MGALAGSVDPWTKRALALLLVGVPVALNPWALDPYDIQTQLLRFLSTVILVGCAVKAVRGEGVPIVITPLSSPLAAAWVVSAVATIASRDRFTSVAELLHLGLLIVLFHVLVSWPGLLSPSLAFGSMAVAGVVIAASGVAQICGVELLGYGAAPTSTPGHPNFLAEVLTLVLPPAVFIAGGGTRVPRVAAGALLLLLGVALGVTHGRAAIAGLLIGTVVAGGLITWWWLEGRLAVKVTLGSLLFTAIVLLAVAFPFTAPRLYQEVASHCVPRGHARAHAPAHQKKLDTQSLTSRLQFWRDTAVLIRDHPFLGVGPGAYVLVFTPEYLSPNPPLWDPSTLEPYAHNELLQSMAETGIAGGLIVLWLAATLLWMIARIARRATRAAEQRLLLATTVALVAIGVSAVFSFPFHLSIQQLYILVHAALLAGLSQAQAPAPRIIRFSAPLARLVALLLLVATGGMAISATVSGIHSRRAWQAHEVGDSDGARSQSRRARLWDPLRARRSDLERLLVLKAHGRGLEEVRRRLAVTPDDPALNWWRGSLLMGMGQPRAASQAFRRSLELDPRYAPARKDLATALLALGSHAEAIDQLETYLAIAPAGACDAQGWANLGAARFLNGQRAAAEQAWAEAARCDPTATEYRRQFLRRVERVDALPEQPRQMER